MPTHRPASAADWQAIEALLLASQLPLDGAREHLEAFVVAEDGGTLVGVAEAEAGPPSRVEPLRARSIV